MKTFLGKSGIPWSRIWYLQRKRHSSIGMTRPPVIRRIYNFQIMSTRQPAPSRPDEEDDEVDVDIDVMVEEELDRPLENVEHGPSPSFRDRLRETQALLLSNDSDANDYDDIVESEYREYGGEEPEHAEEDNNDDEEMGGSADIGGEDQSSQRDSGDEFTFSDAFFNEVDLLLSWNTATRRQIANRNDDDQVPLDYSSRTLESLASGTIGEIRQLQPVPAPNPSYTTQWTQQLEISAEDHYIRGVDIQGIDFSAMPLSRSQYRRERLQKFKNYENLHYPPNAEVSSAFKTYPVFILD